MSLRINLNSAAQTAHRMLSGTDNAMGKSIERLSSGFKINSAADDPAGLVISEKLRAQVSGLGQAIKNASDAVNMVKTAEGALNEVSSLLRSMRDLALHAANAGANDDAAVAADQAQIKSAIETLNKIAAETQFGQKKLLDGSANLQATFSSKFAAVDLGKSGILEDTAATVDVTAVATTVSYTGAKDYSGVNTVTGDQTFTINGVAVDVSGGDDRTAVMAAINAKTTQTGVTASASGNFIKLSGAYGAAADIDISGSGANAVFGVTAKTAGTDAVATVTDGNGDPVGGTWTGEGKDLIDDLGNKITLSDTGNVIGTYTDEINLTAGTLVFQVGAYAGQIRTLNLTSTAADQLGKDVDNVTTTSVADINVGDKVKAQEAILVLDAAIAQMSGTRAELGAFQRNVLESNINSLSIAKENIAASESTIRDTDMAAEMVTFTRNQIMNQAGVSMLSQANQAPQNLLSLLK